MIQRMSLLLLSLSLFSLATNVLRIQLGAFQAPLLFCASIFGLLYVRHWKITKEAAILVGLLLGHIAVVLLRGMPNGNEAVAAYVIKLIACIVFFGALHLYFSSLNSQESLAFFVKSTLIASALLTIVYVFYYYFILNSLYLSASIGEVSEQGKNQIAQYLGALTVYSFFCFMQDSKPSSRRIYLFGFTAHLIGLLYTFSRSALISVVVTLTIFSILLLRRKDKGISRRLLLIVFFSVSVVAYLASQTVLLDEFWDNLASIFTLRDSGDSTSIEVRSNLAAQAWQFFYQAPIWGLGTGEFLARIGIVTHNSYLQLLVDNGIIGLATFVAVLLYALFLIKPASNISYGAKPVVLFFLLSLIFINAIDSLIIYFFLAILIIPPYAKER